MKIRVKILAGFMILVGMLFIAGFISIYEFTSISKYIENIIDDNYKTIESSKHMEEALDNENNGVLLLILGNWEEGRKWLYEGDSLFMIHYQVVNKNATEPGEEGLIEDLYDKYTIYKKEWERPIVGTKNEGNMNWYFENLYTSYNDVKNSVKNLMSLNQTSMYKAASQLKDKAKRAIMPGIVAIISGLIFSFMFNYFIDYYVVKPIVRITNSLTKFKHSSNSLDVEIETNDEIRKLADAIDNFIVEVRNNS